MSNRLSSVFPRPSASDPDDVVWTLQTAAVQWQRGLRADAIVWVRKAADTATQLSMMARAEELRDHAARLAEYLWSDPEEEPNGTPSIELSGRRVVSDDDEDEVIEVEEIDAYDLELSDDEERSETDLRTPDDAVASISPEELASYSSDVRPSERVLPDDLDLRSDSERAGPPRHDSFLSIEPEPYESSMPPMALESAIPAMAEPAFPSEPETAGRDSYLSVAPDDDDEETHAKIAIDSLAPRASLVEQEIRTARPKRRITAPGQPAFSSGVSKPAPASRASSPRSSPPRPGASKAPTGRPPVASRRLNPSVQAPPQSESPATVVDGLSLEVVEVLADLPEEAQADLVKGAALVRLAAGDALVLSEGAALVTRGSVNVTLTNSEVSAARVSAGSVIAARGSIEGGALRLISDDATTHLVTWSDEQLNRAMQDCPWVVDDLRLIADRFHAHASAGLGPLGQRLDDALRAAVYERLEVRVLSPSESIAERGKPLQGLFVVAMGDLEVENGTKARRIGAGEFVFPGCVIGAEMAPADVRAGPKGGLVLFATRPVAHELMMSVPPLLEILAS
jgi:hypothetical protein